ncbi:MAG: thiol reductant ABC exporter subunit CydD [Anaerolineae bacterium]|nr:thiol reductant ABC exporter subunit CydD [Anaerolineae bacterium]
MKLDRRLLRDARAARADLACTVGLGLLAGIVLVGQARALSRVIGQAFLGGRSLPDLLPLLAVLVALALLRTALAWAAEEAAQRAAGRIKGDLQDRLSAHLLALGPIYARGERTGELANTVVEGVEALDAYIRHYLPQVALAALVPITLLLFIFPLDWISGLILLLTAPLIPVFMVLIGNQADALTRRQWLSLSRMSAHFLDVLQGLTALKLLDRSREQIQVIAQISDRYRQTTMGVLRVSFLSALVLEMVATIGTAIVAVGIGLRLLYGHLEFEQALFVLLLAPEFYLPLRLLGTRFHAGMSGVAAAQRIFGLLETRASTSPIQDAGAARRLASRSRRPQSKIQFHDVHYAYDAGLRPALNGLSLEILPGQKVALVGPSGAGKTTIAYLLLRFIEPDRGAITVGGRPLSDIPPPAWRAEVAWVPQNPYLFYGTVADNIRLARPEAGLDQVIHAARQANAHLFIDALPDGYDTLIGERGARLSGGEAQRIALARAFLTGAPLLILDEATANLDPQTEASIQEATASLLRGRTALIIAHRLGTVRRADQILVVDGGQVAQQGTHELLMQQDGLYRRLIGAYVTPLNHG